jgi:hypothetical protein
MVPKGGQSGVRFIDFGFAHAIVDSEDYKREQAQLQEIIDKCFFEQVGCTSSVPKNELLKLGQGIHTTYQGDDICC